MSKLGNRSPSVDAPREEREGNDRRDERGAQRVRFEWRKEQAVEGLTEERLGEEHAPGETDAIKRREDRIEVPADEEQRPKPNADRDDAEEQDYRVCS